MSLVTAIVPDDTTDVYVLRSALLRDEVGGRDVVVDGEEEGELKIHRRSRNERAVLMEVDDFKSGCGDERSYGLGLDGEIFRRFGVEGGDVERLVFFVIGEVVGGAERVEIEVLVHADVVFGVVEVIHHRYVLECVRIKYEYCG